MDLAHIEGLQGVVVSGEYQDNIYKLVSSGFGLQGEYSPKGPVIKNIKPGQGKPFQDLFEDDVGKQIKEIFEVSSVIFLLKEELVPLLTSSISSVLAEKLALFSSIFGMEPATLVTASRYMFSEIDPTNPQALTLEVSSYIQNVLLDKDIFGPWMMYIKELVRKIAAVRDENISLEETDSSVRTRIALPAGITDDIETMHLVPSLVEDEDGWSCDC